MHFNDPNSQMIEDDSFFDYWDIAPEPLLIDSPPLPPLLSECNGLPPLPESLDQYNDLSPIFDPFLLNTQPKDIPFDDIDLDSFAWDVIRDAMPLGVMTQAPSSHMSNTSNSNSMELVCIESGEENLEKQMARRGTRSSELGFDEIRRYFYMPITRAAKEMNVGLTVLKKRCRELGIPRWPHRKMKSLNSLIYNVQELGLSKGEEGIRRELETLEEQRRRMEENPKVQLTESTKKLRQFCFKVNYKKRRGMMQYPYLDHHRTFIQ